LTASASACAASYLDAGVIFDVAGQVPQRAVDADGDRIACKTLADALGNFGAACRRVELLFGSVR
jgi:hypothetical protein